MKAFIGFGDSFRTLLRSMESLADPTGAAKPKDGINSPPMLAIFCVHKIALALFFRSDFDCVTKSQQREGGKAVQCSSESSRVV